MPKGSSPAQQVPALIQFHLNLRQPLTVRVAQRRLFTQFIQAVFFCDQFLDMPQNRLVWVSRLGLHRPFLLRSPARSLNRRSTSRPKSSSFDRVS
jgi:hypothetical protein